MGACHKVLILALVGLLVGASRAFAWPPTFGAEFNFSNEAMDNSRSADHIVDSPESQAGRDKMMEVVRSWCQKRRDCKVRTLKNHYGVTIYRVQYSDGWWFQIDTDPGVVEVQTKPSTIKTLEAKKNRMERDIFGAARAAGLEDSQTRDGRAFSAGHIHIGLRSGIGEDANLFRNFLVDYANHSELSAGIFSWDHDNAVPISALPEEKQKRFAALIEEFDQKKIRGIRDLAERISQEVYDSSGPSGWVPTQKYQSLNVTRVLRLDLPLEQRTIEIRAIPAQRSAQEFLDHVKLLQKRIEYLKKMMAPIPLALKKISELRAREAAERFYYYVADTGLSFAPYERYLTPRQRSYLPEIRAREAGGGGGRCSKLYRAFSKAP